MYSGHLSHKAVICMRDDLDVVDGVNFYAWTAHSVASVSNATSGGRKILLTYEANCMHLRVRVLILFLDKGIISYTFPAHTSSMLQQCDKVVLAKYNAELNDVITSLITPGYFKDLDMYQF